MRRLPAFLPACRARRAVSILRRAHRFGRPAAGDGLILTTTRMPSATPSRSSLLTRPETGRGQASLCTAAAAPDHRLWTTLRGPVDPSRLPTCPLPRRRAVPPTAHQLQPLKGETIYSNPLVAYAASGTSTGPYRWAIPEYRSEPY